MKQVKCNNCGYIGDYDEFPKGRDFFQHAYIAGCPKECGNRQSPGGASMRMFDGERPFSFIDRPDEPADALGATLHRADEAS